MSSQFKKKVLQFFESPQRDSNSGSRETSEQKSDALPTELFWPLTFAKVSCIFIYVICRQIGARNRQIGAFLLKIAKLAARGSQRAPMCTVGKNYPKKGRKSHKKVENCIKAN